MNVHEKRSDELATVAIAATFVAEPVQSSLAFWLRELGIRTQIVFAPYNQVFQQLIDPSSLFAANSVGFNVILARIEDWARLGTGGWPETDFSSSSIERTLDDLRRALITASERTSRPFVVLLCPASGTVRDDPEQAIFLKEKEARVASELSRIHGVYGVSSEELALFYPVAEYDDRHANELAHIPYIGTLFTALGTMIARKIASIVFPRPKAIVLDCDETLWGGICGEDGATGVRIDAARAKIQQFMVRQVDAGMLLCLCSKNNEGDVFEVFDRRAEMLLKRDHIVSSRINWNRKSENIKSLAKELNLGLDSFIFLDDNPLECAEVQANCPDVLTLRLPEDANSVSTFLNHLWILDPISQSGEARRRTELYRNNSQRDQVLNESLTFREFLENLDLEIQIAALTADDVPRVAELSQRTNQFNLTTIRRSESEVRDVCRPGGAECLVVRVRDRFGDYGLVGVMIINVAARKMSVDTFLLSCRALGRGVEHRMLAKLGEIASERGLDRTDVRYRPTSKNSPALAFLDSVGASFKEQADGDYVFRFPSEFAVHVTFAADVMDRANALPAEPPYSNSEPAVANDAARAKADLWGLIMEEMHDVEHIHSVVSAQRSVQTTSAAPFVPPSVPVEQTLAAIYSEVLGVEQIGIYDNFFDLGGHSLLAMQVLSRVRETFQVDIPIGVLFTSEFTINDLAREIGKNCIEQASPEQLDHVLQQLDGLSDEEVKGILTGSNPPYPEHESE
jgi:FkbH-like protein